MSGWTTVWVGAHFVPILFALVWMLWVEKTQSWWLLGEVAVLVIWASWSFGALLEGRHWAWRGEMVRIVVTGLAVIGLASTGLAGCGKTQAQVEPAPPVAIGNSQLLPLTPVKWQCASGAMKSKQSNSPVLRGGGSMGGPAPTLKVWVGALHPHDPGTVKTGEALTLTASESIDGGRRVELGEHRIDMKDVSKHLRQGTFTHKDEAVRLSCWLEDPVGTFRYHSERGECVNGRDETGANPWPIERIRETGDAECTRLAGVELGEADMNYPILDWNFKGADLNGALLSFAHIKGGQLQGAKMKMISYGYANITGQGDDATVLPESGCERMENSQVNCSL